MGRVVHGVSFDRVNFDGASCPGVKYAERRMMEGEEVLDKAIAGKISEEIQRRG
jgi:hypothetical protein